MADALMQVLNACHALMESLAEQQATPDDSWRSRFADLKRAALAEQPAQGEAVAAATIKAARAAVASHEARLAVASHEARLAAASSTQPDGYLYECGTAFGVHRQIEQAATWNGVLLSPRPYWFAPPAPSVSVPDEITAPERIESAWARGWNACRAAMLASGDKASVPGWKWVPVEPTPEMLRHTHAGAASYRALLAAAPEVPR